jgi:hypothetical protein
MGLAQKTNSFAPLILINGEKFLFRDPRGGYLSEYDYATGKYYNTVNNPAIGYTEQSEQLVRSTRNAKGQVVAQKINRRLNKFDNLYWPYLSRISVNWLKQQIAKFDCNISYWDDETETFRTRSFYWGDFEATPCEWETVRLSGTEFSFKRPIWYKDVKCNLIDKRILIKIIRKEE